MTLGDKIIEVAERFEGLVEVVSNSEWDDLKTKGLDKRAADFEAMIKRVGHKNGWPYCMSFCEGVWRVAMEELRAKEETLRHFAKLLNPSVMSSFNACNREGLISNEPKRGAVMFLQKGSSALGHAGLVTHVAGEWYHTIEANTSPADGNERDGGVGMGGVWRKQRMLNYGKRPGLHLRGFLPPVII